MGVGEYTISNPKNFYLITYEQKTLKQMLERFFIKYYNLSNAML